MTAQQKTTALKAKAKAGLSNPDKVKDADIAGAIAEADAIVADKAINDAYYIDIAYLRFLTIVGTTPSEVESRLYANALKALEVAVQTVDNKPSYGITTAQRETKW